jgi:hypothetical protein
MQNNKWVLPLATQTQYFFLSCFLFFIIITIIFFSNFFSHISIYFCVYVVVICCLRYRSKPFFSSFYVNKISLVQNWINRLIKLSIHTNRIRKNQILKMNRIESHYCNCGLRWMVFMGSNPPNPTHCPQLSTTLDLPFPLSNPPLSLLLQQPMFADIIVVKIFFFWTNIIKIIILIICLLQNLHKLCWISFFFFTKFTYYIFLYCAYLSILYINLI